MRNPQCVSLGYSWGLELNPHQNEFISLTSPASEGCLCLGPVAPASPSKAIAEHLQISPWHCLPAVCLRPGKDSQECTRATQIIQDNILTLGPLLTRAKFLSLNEAGCLQVPGIRCVCLREMTLWQNSGLNPIALGVLSILFWFGIEVGGTRAWLGVPRRYCTGQFILLPSSFAI